MKRLDDMSDEQILEGLVNMAPHAVIAHHIPGRIRLKISLEGVKALNGRLNAEETLRIPGILSTRINRFARSVVIDYDDRRIPYDLWDRLGRIRERPEDADDVVKRLRAVLDDGGGSE